MLASPCRRPSVAEPVPLSARKKMIMPKVKLIPILEEIHGSMYDLVFKKSPQGEMIVTKKPDMSNVKWSKARKANRKHMSAAIAAAQFALLDPKVKTKYERRAKKLGRRAWNLALSDCLKGKDLRAK
jgi:hypothetical protein